MNGRMSLLLLSLCLGLPLVARGDVTVVATIKPLQLIAAAVIDGHGETRVLINPDQSPHHYSMRPSDRMALAEADLILWVGEPLEAYLAAAFNNADLQSRTLSALTLDLPARLSLRSSHGHLASDRDRIDPHVWLHTGNARVIAEAIADRVSGQDAANAAHYAGNLARFKAAMDQLDATVLEQVGPLRQKSFAVYHDAMQYFEKQFALPHALALVDDPEQAPGMRHLLDMRAALHSVTLDCLLTDVAANPRTIDTLLEGAPLRQVRLDLLGSGVSTTVDGYSTLMRRLVDDIHRCLAP